jgi:hypothetical protein
MRYYGRCPGAGFEAWRLPGVYQIAEPLGAAKHGFAGVLDLSRGVPKNVEFQVSRGPVPGVLKGGAALLHRLPRNPQGLSRVRPIQFAASVVPPDSRPDLVTGNLTGSADGVIIVP